MCTHWDCVRWFFPPPFVSIVYLYGAEEHAGKKARCELAFFFLAASQSAFEKKSLQGNRKNVRKKLFRTQNGENHGNCLGINYQKQSFTIVYSLPELFLILQRQPSHAHRTQAMQKQTLAPEYSGLSVLLMNLATQAGCADHTLGSDL